MFGKWFKRKTVPDVDQFGRTPLHYAARDGDAALLERLITGGADVNALDVNRWTPLHFAAQAVSPAVAAKLIEAGANVAVRDRFGNTPLLRAVFSSRGDGTVIELLLSAGADPNAPNDSDVTPIKLARTIANYDVAQFFKGIS
jgi:ankyrin repeat protein